MQVLRGVGGKGRVSEVEHENREIPAEQESQSAEMRRSTARAAQGSQQRSFMPRVWLPPQCPHWAVPVAVPGRSGAANPRRAQGAAVLGRGRSEGASAARTPWTFLPQPGEEREGLWAKQLQWEVDTWRWPLKVKPEGFSPGYAAAFRPPDPFPTGSQAASAFWVSFWSCENGLIELERCRGLGQRIYLPVWLFFFFARLLAWLLQWCFCGIPKNSSLRWCWYSSCWMNTGYTGGAFLPEMGCKQWLHEGWQLWHRNNGLGWVMGWAQFSLGAQGEAAAVLTPWAQLCPCTVILEKLLFPPWWLLHLLLEEYKARSWTFLWAQLCLQTRGVDRKNYAGWRAGILLQYWLEKPHCWSACGVVLVWWAAHVAVLAQAVGCACCCLWQDDVLVRENIRHSIRQEGTGSRVLVLFCSGHWWFWGLTLGGSWLGPAVGVLTF